MRAYRYLDNEWGPRLWREGLIGISTTASVAAIEGCQQDDADSAVALTFSHHFAGNTDHEPAAKALAAHMGYHFEDCRNVSIIDATRVDQVPGYIFCMAKRPDSDAFPGKEWVFEIADTDAFARSMYWESGDERLRRFLDKEVSYDARRFDLKQSGLVPGDPFVKSEKYRGEEEVRIFWPCKPPPGPRFSVVCPETVRRHVRLVRAPVAIPGAAKSVPAAVPKPVPPAPIVAPPVGPRTKRQRRRDRRFKPRAD